MRQVNVVESDSALMGPPILLDLERNRVVVFEALQRAAMAANAGR